MKAVVVLVALVMMLFGGNGAYAMEGEGEKPLLPLTMQEQRLVEQQCEQYDLSSELVFGMILANQENDQEKERYGLMQLSMETYQWVGQQLGMETIDPDKNELGLTSGIWYLKGLREYWLDQGYSDEAVLSLMLVSCQQDVRSAEALLEKQQWEDEYVNRVLYYKYLLERGWVEEEFDQGIWIDEEEGTAVLYR